MTEPRVWPSLEQKLRTCSRRKDSTRLPAATPAPIDRTRRRGRRTRLQAERAATPRQAPGSPRAKRRWRRTDWATGASDKSDPDQAAADAATAPSTSPKSRADPRGD
ncbi:hypothetical protein VZT92_008625 [Zoarces viviparus]|uniref:Uncharacterized protein n=1 Tax=Zoarces viviparus TaxID=48416 RepID=A0AAW1FFS3_ZOAVI